MDEVFSVYSGFFASDGGEEIHMRLANDVPDASVASLRAISRVLAMPRFVQAVVDLAVRCFTKFGLPGNLIQSFYLRRRRSSNGLS